MSEETTTEPTEPTAKDVEVEIEKFDPASFSDRAYQVALTEGVEGVVRDLGLIRTNAREVVRYAREQLELDQMAGVPTSTGVTSSKISLVLDEEVDRMTKELKMYNVISQKPENAVVELDDTGEVIDPSEARERRAMILSKLLEIKRSCTEEQKAMEPTMQANTQINVNVGSLVSDALSNIKKAEEVE